MEEIGPSILELDDVPALVAVGYDEYQRLLAVAAPSSAQLSKFALLPPAWRTI